MFPDRDAVPHDDVQTNIQKKIQKPPMIILSGPTAVGKTKLSIALAKAIGGEIISADSCQVYRHMDIGSAKIRPEEMQGIPHHMIDILEPWEEFSVAVFKEKCEQCLPGIYERGHIPIVTGGTGFYVQALLRDIDFGSGREETFPEQDNTTPHSVTGDILSAMVCGAGNSPSAADTSVCRASGNASMKENNMLPGEASASNGSYRARLEELAEREGPARLHDMLREVDPASAETIHPNNQKRVIRALEFFYLTGEPISRHNERERRRPSAYASCYFVLNDLRERIYARIDERVDGMLEMGLVAEVEALKAMGCHRGMVSMQALGYKEILAYLDGECSFAEAVERIKRDTRHFAKRQLTWFRREKDVIWIDKSEFHYDDAEILRYMRERIAREQALCPEAEM